jgi:signal transduction histidine kinase
MANIRLGGDADTHLYRIAQEALNNIAKHAKAKRVNVLLEKREEEVVLILEDDGVGFVRHQEQEVKKGGKGLGLRGMGERASLIGGTLEIESAPGQGTTIYASIPINGKLK